MKRLFIILLSGATLSGCASMLSLENGSTADANQRIKSLQMHNEQMILIQQNQSYPKIVVTANGQHATIIKPTGNLSVIVNPDGTHSTAVINGSTATIITH